MQKETALLALTTLPYLLAISIASCEEAGRVDCEIKIKVTQEDGTAVEAANIAVRYAVGAVANPGGGFPTDKNETTRASTNAIGEAILKYRPASSPEGLLWITKDNYYTTIYKEHLWKNKGTDLKSFGTEISAILKPIKTPIPMIARKDLRIRTPQFDVAYGFDLEMGESLPPLGNGKIADIEFILSGTRTDLGKDNKEHIDFRMEIRCPNPNDGFVEFMIEDSTEFSKGSTLASGHECPEAGYNAILSRQYSNDKDGGMAASMKGRQDNKNKCAYFRVRTRKDETGKIVSAHYGKIYGPLEIRPAYKQYGHYDGNGEGGFFMQYTYFNPTPNDRNVEFDTKKNLLPDGNVTKP